jgi:hypothetical protein
MSRKAHSKNTLGPSEQSTRYNNSKYYRDNIQEIMNEELSLHFSSTRGLASVKMNIELRVTILEASTGLGAAHMEHDHLITNQFVMKQLQNVRKGFSGPSHSSRLLTALGRNLTLYNQGYNLNLIKVFERMPSSFFGVPLSSTDMVFFGQYQTVMSSSPSDFRNLLSVSKKNVKFPGYEPMINL